MIADPALVELLLTDSNFPLSGQPFAFKIEDTELQKSNNLILGSSANLVCSFIASADPGKEPNFQFYKFFGNGTAIEIKNMQKLVTTTKYTISSKLHKSFFKETFTNYTIRLSLENISTDADITFLCRVAPHGNYCQLEKELRVKTSKY